ncbi:nanos RNA binding domain protein [Ancylostoma caninum]|uniref:Nanos RNA binding domain protein n=1 Tax=Ancylostoma caninum TaxID=29170 RepID=A0A368HDC2_ANCCA|nr:nanos RNA binding domain protein [Ancylostoma caninum]
MVVLPPVIPAIVRIMMSRRQRAESMLSDFLNGSDHTIYEVDGESDADSPPHDPSHGCSVSPGLTPSPQAPPCSSPKQHRYCWYCYETYKAMCLAQGKTPPGVYSRGLWRGHCMRDSNGVTTCPHLWFTKCTHCGATAGSAHSPEFCPMLNLTGLTIHDQ